MIGKFKTNLNCDSCVAAVAPLLDAEERIERWSVDTADARKVLSVEGETISAETVERLVAEAGFHVLGTVFNLPMSKVAFIEDALMAAMAVAMLGALFLGWDVVLR